MDSGVRVLIVDDNLGDRLLLSSVLRSILPDCSIIQMEDGEAALSYLIDKKEQLSPIFPQLVFLDLNMPKLHGLEVLKRLKDDQILRLIPIVVFSSSESSKDVNGTYFNQANAYVTKPIMHDEYHAVIERTCETWFKVVSLPSVIN